MAYKLFEIGFIEPSEEPKTQSLRLKPPLFHRLLMIEKPIDSEIQ